MRTILLNQIITHQSVKANEKKETKLNARLILSRFMTSEKVESPMELRHFGVIREMIHNNAEQFFRNKSNERVWSQSMI